MLTEDTADLLPNQCLVRFRGMVSALFWGSYGRMHGRQSIKRYHESPIGAPAL